MSAETIFICMLILAAWQDLKTGTIDIRLLIVFGCIGLLLHLSSDLLWYDRIASSGIGVILLILNKLTNGGIGEGDGWFFVVTGLYLDWERNLLLFLGGLGLCFLWSLPLAVQAILRKGSGRKRELPFLPFLLPAGIWMVFI